MSIFLAYATIASMAIPSLCRTVWVSDSQYHNVEGLHKILQVWMNDDIISKIFECMPMPMMPCHDHEALMGYIQCSK